VADNCSTGNATLLYAKLGAYLSRDDVRTALHATNSNAWQLCTASVANQLNANVNPYVVLLTPDNSPTYDIFPYLVSQHIAIHVFSGERDFVLPHTGTEFTLANTTWGGKQGFTSAPNAVFYGPSGEEAGTYGEERGLSYHLFSNSGHMVGTAQPAQALKYLIEFVLNGNPW
jgi:carboxypeptidase D